MTIVQQPSVPLLFSFSIFGHVSIKCISSLPVLPIIFNYTVLPLTHCNFLHFNTASSCHSLYSLGFRFLVLVPILVLILSFETHLEIQLISLYSRTLCQLQYTTIMKNFNLKMSNMPYIFCIQFCHLVFCSLSVAHTKM